VLEELPHEGLGKGGEVGKWFIGTEVQLSTYPGLGDLPAAVVHVIVRWAAWPQRHLATDRCGQGLVDVRVVAAHHRAVRERDLHRGSRALAGLVEVAGVELQQRRELLGAPDLGRHLVADTPTENG